MKKTYSWHPYFLKMAALVATKSKDRSTKVGAVIVGPDNEVRSTGYNGFPRGINDDVPKRHDRPAKYDWTEHAERNAVFNAARMGMPLNGCTLYINFSPCPCLACSRAVIQSGITHIVVPYHSPFPGKGPQWEHELRVAQEMLAEAGVTITQYGTPHASLLTPLELLMSTKDAKQLAKAGLSNLTLNEVIAHTEFQFLVRPNVGKHLLVQIKSVLTRYGLRFGMSVDDIASFEPTAPIKLLRRISRRKLH